MAALPDDSVVRRLATEIVARPEYARYRTSMPDWARDALQWLGSLFDRLAELAHTRPALYFTLLAALLVVAALLIAHVVYTLIIAMRHPERAHAANVPAPARDLAAEAQALADSRAYGPAAHAMLLATLAFSASARLIELHPEDGNRMIRTKLRRSRLAQPLQQRLIELIDRTEATWFGGRAPEPELYLAWREVYSQLREGRA